MREKRECEDGVRCRRCGKEFRIVYELDDCLFCADCVIKELGKEE